MLTESAWLHFHGSARGTGPGMNNGPVANMALSSAWKGDEIYRYLLPRSEDG
jgi:hypothetical protein